MTNPYDYNALIRLGVALDDAIALRRIAMTLHRWYEGECGNGDDYKSWSITRGHKKDGAFVYDEDNGTPFHEIHPHRGDTRTQYHAIPDREKGAHKRLAKIMKNYPRLAFYLQTDPRGAPLYILDRATTPEPYSQHYNRGVAVYQ